MRLVRFRLGPAGTIVLLMTPLARTVHSTKVLPASGRSVTVASPLAWNPGQVYRYCASQEGGTVASGATYMWGVPIRHGFNEFDDPWYHRGRTAHAFRTGNESAAVCGYRPWRHWLRPGRQVKLALPSAGIHSMCPGCVKRVTPVRPRVGVPVTPAAERIAVPIEVAPEGARRFEPTGALVGGASLTL